jgi:putative two-component system response regulator
VEKNKITILAVDDNIAQLHILKGILKQAGYDQVVTTENPYHAIQMFEKINPDLVLLDLRMPGMDGFAVIEVIKRYTPADVYLPIIMLTADARPDIMQQALTIGAHDFIAKPFNATEVKLRTENLLKMRLMHQKMRGYNEELEEKIKIRTQKLEQTQIEMLVRLAHAAEYRDDESGEHVWRISHTSWMIAQELGLSAKRSELLLRAARLHDVGKIGIPDNILLKPGRLTPEEFDRVKTHTTIGAKLLSGGDSPLMRLAELIALTHHERWDGTGYPKGLKGEDIPVESRIMAVADTFDAITHNRVHQKAMSVPEAIAEIKLYSGRQFDPTVVGAFVNLYERGETFYISDGNASSITIQSPPLDQANQFN